MEHPVVVSRRGAPSPFLLVGDHAGREIPARLGDLGLNPPDRDRHIACDLGVEAFGRALSERLDAPFLRQRYSRLVIDCNRDPDHPGSILQVSDGVPIPGNADISMQEGAWRRRHVFEPYHAAISAALDAGPAIFLVSLHSFTPTLQGRDRPWPIGVLHRDDSRLSQAVLMRLRAALGRDVVGDNEPYRMDDTDYTVPRHCDPRGLDYLELELRQDELASASGCSTLVALVADALVSAGA